MQKIIVILGPTGVGKTKLSVSLAKLLNGEIINADSMQVYRGLNIGTAKITEEEKEGIPHHLFDIKNVDENYTIYDYQRDARDKINEILKKGKTPILVGGSGLYIKSCLYDYKFSEESYHSEFDELTNEEILKEIKKYHETTIHVNNRKRLIRELNIIKNNSKKTCDGNKKLYDFIPIGLTTNRQILYDRINLRVDEMVKQGLIEEAKSLYDQNLNTKAIQTAIAYKELYNYFSGKMTLKESCDLIRKNSRNFAKRQYTFFNHQMEVNWFNVDFENFNNTINEVYNFIVKECK